jgi:hypothetical protein
MMNTLRSCAPRRDMRLSPLSWKDLEAICRLYLAVEPLQPKHDAARRRALAKRIIGEGQ